MSAWQGLSTQRLRSPRPLRHLVTRPPHGSPPPALRPASRRPQARTIARRASGPSEGRWAEAGTARARLPQRHPCGRAGPARRPGAPRGAVHRGRDMHGRREFVDGEPSEGEQALAILGGPCPSPINRKLLRCSGAGEPPPYRSSGVRPVRFAILASMRGPISSRSWNANTKSGHPERSRVRCDPVCRLVAHPMRSSAASTRLARVLGQEVTPPEKRCAGGQG